MSTRKLLAICAAAAIAACGSDKDDNKNPGGGTVKYTGPTTTVTMSDPADVGVYITQIAGMGGAVSGASSIGFIGMMGAANAAPNAGVLQAIQLASSARRTAPATAAGVVQSATQPCEASGTMTFTVNDGDGVDTTTQAGDYVEIALANCTAADGSKMNGSMRLEITSAPSSGSFDDLSTVPVGQSFGLALNLTDFSQTAADGSYSAINGDVSVTMARTSTTKVTMTISGTSIAGEERDAAGTTTSFGLTGPGGTGQYSEIFSETYVDSTMLTVSEFSWSLDARACSTEMGGCLSVDTTTAFAQYFAATYPYAGAFKIFDDAGSYVRIQANADDTVTVWFDLDGTGGGTEQGPFTASWSCLETAADSSTCW